MKDADIDDFEIYKNKEIVDILPYKDGYKLTVIDKNNLYDGSIPRLKPFILAYGRYYLSKQMEQIGTDNIIRVHTDSIMIKDDVFLNVSDKLGDWKFEGEKHVEINNIRSK